MEAKINMDKMWPGYLIRSFTVRKRMAFLAVPAVLAAGWLIFPALTKDFKQSVGLGFLEQQDPLTLSKIKLANMTKKDSIQAKHDDE